MKKSYLVGPCLANFAAWYIGNGTVSLVPLYAAQRGASAGEVGLFMAIGFACLTAGTLLPGLLPKRLGRILLGAGGSAWGLMGIVLSRSTTLLGFEAGMVAAFTCGGLVLAQAAVLTALSAPAGERGTATGILGGSGGLGSLVGALAEGWLAQRFGFRAVFLGCAGAALLIVFGSLLAVKPGSVPDAQDSVSRVKPGAGTAVGAALILLVVSQLLLSVTNSASTLDKALSMGQQGFSMLAINSTSAVSGAGGFVLPLVLGWLSDRVGRRWLVIAPCLVSAAGLLVLASATALWQFYLFAALNSFLSVSSGVGQAFVMDVVPREGVARGVTLFQAGSWTGSFGGMLAGGLAAQAVGIAPSMLFCIALVGAAALLVLVIRKRRAATGMVPRAGTSSTRNAPS